MKTISLLLILFLSLWGGSNQAIQTQKIKIALLSSPTVIGRYTQSTYDVALATLMASHQPFELTAYTLPNESKEAIAQALEKIHSDQMSAILAPLTLGGVKNLLALQTTTPPIFIPTVHKRDSGTAPETIIFGAIDYQAQIIALAPYMGKSLAVFYGDSLVGKNLALMTQTTASESKKGSIPSALYSVNTEGSNIVSYLAKPSAFSKKSIITHLPVVKTSMLIAHLTFVDVHEHNILSTQINFDPNLISLTQYKDRKNMIVANSIIEQVPAIYETNELMNNDLTFDWINYTTSVGIDYLNATLRGVEREYSMQMVDSQIIYPVELMRPKEFGFEPLGGK
ncbi:MAG: hypothetical protein NTY39_08250 [Campylobacterales bacterium]|nr:hypothetical protein [Campylobacterales bacterium]